MKVSSILFLIGGILVTIGFVVPLLMVTNYIPKLLWLEMVIGIIQMVGLCMGIIGSVIYVKTNRDRNKKY